MRTIVDLPQELVTDLDSLAEKQKISRAEAVRRAVASYIGANKPGRTDAAFGIWKSKRIDALDYEDSVRGEWHR